MEIEAEVAAAVQRPMIGLRMRGLYGGNARRGSNAGHECPCRGISVKSQQSRTDKDRHGPRSRRLEITWPGALRRKITAATLPPYFSQPRFLNYQNGVIALATISTSANG